MNNSLNEYLRFNFELNHFLARFNVKMNNQNVSPTPNRSSKNQNGRFPKPENVGKLWLANGTIF